MDSSYNSDSSPIKSPKFMTLNQNSKFILNPNFKVRNSTKLKFYDNMTYYFYKYLL